ncbi:MAG: glycosyltransferase [Paucibacter sp.]|nr:glycosyltransferase [Roseateles sp.]
MKKALVLTRSWSDSPETATHGLFQSLSLFLDALGMHVPHIDMLVFAPDGPELESLASRHASRYRQGSVQSITVTAVPRAPNPVHWGSIDRYVGGALSVDRQENYINIADTACVQAVRNALQKRPTLVFAHRLPVFTPLLKQGGETLPPILFDMDDIEHKALIRGLMFAPRWPSERLRLLHTPALMLRERAAVRASRHTFVCSQEDANLLQRISGSSCVSAVPNAVAAPSDLPVRVTAGSTFGFIGSFAHPPNLDAATWLIEDIWPRIRKIHPDADLKIAGAGSAAALAHYAGTPGLTVLDFVPDVGSFYNDVTVVLAPLRFGAGTRVKIIEAAGYGLPTISTRIGAEGLVFRPEEEIVLAESAEQIASSACRLLNDHAAALRIGLAARACYQRNYGRQKAIESISGHITRILETPTVR